MLGVDRATTRKAAKAGLVRDARRETRPGTINSPWVATRDDWQEWFASRPRVGRPTSE